MKRKIIFLKGLPASGKSTWAKEYCRNRSNFVRLNKDDIREELGNPKWSQKFENEVLAKQRARGINALTLGKSIIIDDTNFADKHRNFWMEIANKMNVEFEQKYFDVPIDECIRRDKEREKSVGEKVIRMMYGKYVRPANTHTDDRFILEQDSLLPRCIIVDVDGTLALHNGRNPYDYKKCDTDKVNLPVKHIVQSYSLLYDYNVMNSDGESCGDRIIILSGRDGIAREDTEKCKIIIEKDGIEMQFKSQGEAASYIETLGFKCSQSRISNSLRRGDKIHGFKINKI